MNTALRVLVALLVASLATAWSAQPPNILFILCDDLGYGDLGVLFQNARAAGLPKTATPNLDRMAAQGLQMHAHYSPAPVCAPARASLLLGVTQGHSNVRDNQFDKALDNNHTLGTVMKQAGYATACVGKWGLQGTGTNALSWPAYPTKRGFDYYYGYVRHSDGHEHYPKEGLYEGKKEVWDNNTEVSATLDKCYTADLWTACAKKWIVAHQATNAAQPFFLYLAYDTPHAVTELPTQPYPAGGGTNGGLQWLGTNGHMINTASGTIDSYIHPAYTNATYDDDGNTNTAQVPWPDVYKRYATAVRRLDDATGDLTQLLQDLRIDTNTLVIFTSDNGPSIECYLPQQSLAANFFDSYGPFDGIKRDCWEGGIRMATLARWPGHIAAGGTNDQPNAFWDWMPTFAELAGLPAPVRSDGVSLVPTLTGAGSQRPSTIYIEYYENESTPTYPEFEPAHRGRKRNQMQVVGVGGYQGVRYNIATHADDFEIYDVLNDPKESINFATNAAFAALQQQMKDRVLQVRMVGGGVTRPYDLENVPSIPAAVTNGVLDYAAYEGIWPWLPDFSTLTAVSTGRVAGLDVSVRTRPDNAGLLFTGYITIPADDAYTFYLTTDTAAQLRIHEAQVIDDDFAHTGGEVSGTIRLQAGLHPIRLSYRHASGTPNLSLLYSSSVLAKQPVPAAAFSASCPGCVTPPTAHDDTASTPQNTPVSINVLANDLDDGLPQPLSIVAVGLPHAGTAVTNAGQIVYTPNAGFLGEDTFSYTISDGQSTATAQVRVQVFFQDGNLWFPFNEVGGYTTAEAGGAYTALLSGFPDDLTPWVTGRYNRAIEFDGTNDLVTVTGFPGILGTNARTVAAWVKTTATISQAIVGWGVNGTNGAKWSFILNAAGNLREEVDNGYLIGTAVLNDGQWHHAAVTWSNGITLNITNAKFYVDGKLDSISGKSNRVINTLNGGDMMIGCDNQSRFFAGDIDEVHIYNRALSAAEIAALAVATNQSAAAWQRRYFGNAATNWSADDDGDGASRLMEYALGSQPHIADAEAFYPQPEIAAGHLQIRFPRRVAGTHELLYTVQVSRDMLDWTTLTATEVSATPLADRPGFEEAVVRADPPLSGNPQLFMRLTVNWGP